MAVILSSLANSGRWYLDGQGRINNDEELKVQFKGHKGNRSYGFTQNIEDFPSQLNSLDRIRLSLAGTDEVYFPLQASYRDGVAHFQVVCLEGDRDYGVSFDVESDELASWLQDELDRESGDHVSGGSEGDDSLVDNLDYNEPQEHDEPQESESDYQEQVESVVKSAASHAKSLAGSEKIYVLGQGRRLDNGTTHIQFRGASRNRSYGFTVDISTPQELVKLVLDDPVLSSLAGTSPKYFPLQARSYGTGEVHFQVSGFSGNRPYGSSFTIENESLASWLSSQT